MTTPAHAKFDASRAREYGEQARIGLAGYDACHELCACILSAAMSGRDDLRVLVVGAGGTAGEIIAAATLQPGWRFTAVDPSEPMLALARAQVSEAGIAEQVTFVRDEVSALADIPSFHAALMIGVLHHVPGTEDKARLLKDIAARLEPGGSLVFAGNCRSYDSEPLLRAAWANRWRLFGASQDEVSAKLDRIMKGAVPPASEDAINALLAKAGFSAPEKFFSSLFWGAWHVRREE